MVNTLQNTYGIKCKLDDLAIGRFLLPHLCYCKLNSKREAISSTRNPDVKATQIGERIYVDIKSLKPVSRGGFSSYILFYDEFYDWIAISGLQQKSEATSTLDNVNVELGLSKLDHTVTLRPDGDLSRVDCEKFKSKAKSLEFHVDFTPPYTPQHNKAERSIKSIDFKARVSLIDAPHLDFNTHYLDASFAAAYLHNRVVGSKGKTPFEMVKGSQPMISHVMPFGCSGVNHIPVSSGRRKDNPNRGEEVHHIGYRGPLSNQYKVITVEDKKVRHTIHVDWDLPSHGLENALSKEHLEAILEEADLGSVSQLMALENTAADSASNDEQLALNGAIDGLLEILPDGNSGPNLSYLSENDIEIIGKGPNLPEFTDKDIQDILHNQPQVVITPIPSQGVAEDKGDNDLNLSQLSELQDGPLFGSDDHGELDSVNVVEGHRNSVPAQPHNVSSFHMSHDMAVLEAQVEAVAHLAKEIPLQRAFGGPDRTRFIDTWKKDVHSTLKHTAVPITKGHTEYEATIKEATSSTFIANEKRDGRAKFRWVVQG